MPLCRDISCGDIIYAMGTDILQGKKRIYFVGIGGVSMSGGRGSVAGTFLGALILALITRALPLVGIDAIAQNMVKGILILVVVVLNVVTQRMMDRANLERREM